MSTTANNEGKTKPTHGLNDDSSNVLDDPPVSPKLVPVDKTTNESKFEEEKDETNYFLNK